MAGVDHAALFGVYAPRSTGFYSNEELASALTNPATGAADGRPRAMQADGYSTAEIRQVLSGNFDSLYFRG